MNRDVVDQSNVIIENRRGENRWAIERVGWLQGFCIDE
jgi:hypothetical protein